MPSTVLALKIAMVINKNVEDVFILEKAINYKGKTNDFGIDNYLMLFKSSKGKFKQRPHKSITIL